MKLTLSISLASALLIGACASQDTGKAANRAMQDTRSGAARAAMTPLRDLNLSRDQIPGVLQEIQSPYDIPVDTTCDEIRRQLDALNQVLGPDWDALPRHEDDPTISDYAADEVSEELVDIIAGEAGALIPYRSWVRRISGAKSHQKKVDKAKKRGGHRRTYLKALGTAKECDGIQVAAPVQLAEAPLPDVDFRKTVPPQYRMADLDPIEPFSPAAPKGQTADFAFDPPEEALSEEEAYDWPEEWDTDEWAEDSPASSSPSDRTWSSPISD